MWLWVSPHALTIMFVSAPLHNSVAIGKVIESVFNHSDHKPLSLSLRSFLNNRDSNVNVKRGSRQHYLRWDKANLCEYYDVSRELLSEGRLAQSFAQCPVGCSNHSHRHAINCMYNDIVYALQMAEASSVPRIQHNSLKPFWNEHLDDLKQKFMFWGMMWKDAGRPKSGEVYRIKTSCSLKYKMAIKQALYEFEHKFDDKLYEHFLSKEPSQFWKCWNRKFHRSMASNITGTVNGVHDDVGIANEC